MSINDFTISLPACAERPSPANTLTTRGPLVIVGANGAGKSRLATWLEKQAPQYRHRVSAQRSLRFPDDLRGSTIEMAENEFLYGNKDYSIKQAGNKFGFRYGSKHDVLLNDFQKLVTLLFSEGAQVREEYVQRMKKSTTYEVPPERKLDVIQRIWEQVLPNRELVIGGHKVEARKRGATQNYSPHEMSDGERVIFYLIGQCLCAPKNGVILLDEPELHLHRALQTRLWDAVEAERTDCLFVYITHDLDFAASRKGGTHIWLSEYSGGENWEWNEVPSDDALPEALLLEILGSRKPVLLVEGTAGGSDERLYRTLYPEHHVLAFGSCGEVIHATASCRRLKERGQMSVDAAGLIDRDGRSDEELATLAAMGVKALEWAEIENLLVAEAVLGHVAEALHRDGVQDVAAIKERVLEKFSQDAERITSELAGRELDGTIRGWGWKHPDGASLEQSLRAHLDAIDTSEVIARWRSQISLIIEGRDYVSALRLYPNKGLWACAGQVMGISKYGDFVLRRMASREGFPLVAELRRLVPSF